MKNIVKKGAVKTVQEFGAYNIVAIELDNSTKYLYTSKSPKIGNKIDVNLNGSEEDYPVLDEK